MKKKKVMLVGVGAIGRRWLESLIPYSTKYDVICVEPNKQIVEELQKMYEGKISVFERIAEVGRDIDLCAITTTSAVRRKVFDEIIEYSDVSNIIFEKFLFQKEKDYYEVKDVLKNRGIKAWVNCGRRESKGYVDLKEKLKEAAYLSIDVSGSLWGIGCNGIHMIDLAKYLCGEEDIILDMSNLKGPVIESKRPGFYEFFGTISGHTNRGDSITITCYNSDVVSPVTVCVMSDSGKYIIDESRQKVFFSEKNNEWIWKENKFELPYTSQVMGRIIDDILENAECRLTRYEESMELHVMYMKGVNQFLKNSIDWEEDSCPIT